MTENEAPALLARRVLDGHVGPLQADQMSIAYASLLDHPIW